MSTEHARKRIGVFVGSFDPPHIAHRNLVLEIRDHFGLDTVYVYPDAVPNYKNDRQPLHHRQAMLDLAFEQVDGIVTKHTPDLAIKEGKETLWHIHAAIKHQHANDDVFIMMGNDTFDWYSTVLQKTQLPPANIIVSIRNGEQRDFPDALNGGSVNSYVQNDQMLSSTRVRGSLKDSGHTSDIPQNVRDYIEQHNLYVRSTMGDARHWIEREKQDNKNPGNIGIEVVSNPHLYTALISDGIERAPTLSIIDFGGGTGKLSRDLLLPPTDDLPGLRRLTATQKEAWAKKTLHLHTYEKDEMLVSTGQELARVMPARDGCTIDLTAIDLGCSPMPENDASIDIAVSRTFLMHLNRQALSHHLNEAYRILKPGACYHIIVLNPAYQLWNLAYFGRKDIPAPHEKVDFQHGETGNLETYHHYYRDIDTYQDAFKEAGFELIETSHPQPISGWEETHGRYYQSERPLFAYFKLVRPT